jgi:hypothetical protein
VGNGARGLQRFGRRLESFQPRSGALAGLRWGEDGLGGISDDQQLLCFALALWNGADPILSHQTGWTGLIARTMQLFATTTAEDVLELGKAAGVRDARRSAGSADRGQTS